MIVVVIGKIVQETIRIMSHIDLVEAIRLDLVEKAPTNKSYKDSPSGEPRMLGRHVGHF